MILSSCQDNPSENSNNDETSSSEQRDQELSSGSEAVGSSDAGSVGSDGLAGNEDIISDVEDQELATPPPEKQLVICMSAPPNSLYPYGEHSPVAEAIRHALYEPLVTTVGYEYNAFGLEKLPNLSDGDARIENVLVNEGSRVVDQQGKVVVLRRDVMVINSAGETVAYEGSPIEMKQMIVNFTLKPMIWSDGTPVTAEDSEFSYSLAADDELAFRNSAYPKTARYEATGDLNLRWVGLPGYLDQTYFDNVWLPLPAQQDLAILKAGINNEQGSEELRLSSGPFVLDAVGEDGTIVLTKNPHYYRASEGFPKIDQVIIRFGEVEDFLDGEDEQPCALITSDALTLGDLPLLESTAEASDWTVQTVPGMVFEYIAFGVNPNLEYADRRPDWFEEAGVRQALTMCIDRQGLAESLTGGLAQVINSYVPEEHPLYPQDLQIWPYDRDQANQLLDELGYQDYAGDGRRQDLTSGVPMTITLGTNSESMVRLGILDQVQQNLADCNIPVETYRQSAGNWFAPGPQGDLFGRSFDLASLAWLSQIIPDCGLFLSENVTGPEEFGFGGWQNVNVTGWSNEAFDAACHSAATVLPGGEGFEEFQREALRIFNQELPAMPLFTNVKIAAVRQDVFNAQLESSQPSILWNIYEWDIDS